MWTFGIDVTVRKMHVEAPRADTRVAALIHYVFIYKFRHNFEASGHRVWALSPYFWRINNISYIIFIKHSRTQFHLPPLGSLASWRTWGHLMAKVGTSKRGGKQWQTTPKNLPRMQRISAIPVAWLSFGLCPDRPKSWIPIIINNLQRLYNPLY
jgi:hypothetical protein